MRRASWMVGVWAALAASGCYHGAEGDSDGLTAGGTESGSGPGSGSDTEGGSDTAETETSGTPTDTGDPADHAGPFECDPAARPETLSMRRLSRVQYRNTVHDLVRWAVGESADTVIQDIDPVVDRLPADIRLAPHDGPRGGFRRVDQAIQQEHINGSYDVAVATARILSNDHLDLVAGSCAVDGDPGNDDACLDDFIRRFGERALRRPIDDEEVSFYRDVFDAEGFTQGMEPEAFADVITVLMTSPSFLYLVEHGDEAGEGPDGLVQLTGPELAQRLSYQFWQAPPDDALREAAASGALATDEGYEAQVDRMLDDPRAADAVQEFFAEWLWLEDLPALDARIGTPAYDTFLGGLALDAQTQANMIGEVLDSAVYYALDEDGTFDDFFNSDRSFARTADLAAIYGVDVWDGGEPPQFPNPERRGLITRAAFLSTGTPTTRPIMKGVRIREALLCDELDPPPGDAAGTLPELSEDLTTREVVEMLTEQPGTSCAGCHVTQINPLGFVTENFDAIGRFRTEQVLLDENGNVTGQRPVDTSTTPRVDVTDDTPTDSAATVSEMILESGKAQACFSRNYVRWTFGRDEDVQTDGCMLNAMTSELNDGAPIRDVLRQLALRDEFRTRRIEQ